MRLLLQNESVCYYPLCISLIMQRAEPTPGHKYFGFKSRGRDVMLGKAIMEGSRSPRNDKGVCRLNFNGSRVKTVV